MLKFKKTLTMTFMSIMILTNLNVTSFAENKELTFGKKNGMDLIEVQTKKPAVAKLKKRNTPNRIAMNITENPESSIGFNWYTSDKMEDSYLIVSKSKDMSNPMKFKAEIKEVISDYAERDEKGYYIYKSVEDDKIANSKKLLGYFTDEQIDRNNTEWTSAGSSLAELCLQQVTEYSYKATSKNLMPDTKYYFRLGSDEGGLSEVGSFRTAAINKDSFTFIHYTDTQNAYWNANVNNEAKYGADTLQHAMETVPEATFALHTGDFVETAQVEDEWVDNLDMSRKQNMNLPHAYVAGNHDEYNVKWKKGLDLTAFNEHTNTPVTNNKISGGSYYSFDYNGAHFVVLNTNDNKKSDDNPNQGAIGQAQMEWMKNDIKKAKKDGANWIILCYHKPVYSASYHSLQDKDVQVTRQDMVKIADELGVDVVLQGHDHNLTRTKSLVYTPDNFSYANVENTKKIIKDNVNYHVNPNGVTYVIPNTSGTKVYDAIYKKGAKHVALVRPKLSWMTDKDVEKWNSLFDVAEQPWQSENFKVKHSNYRQSEKQHFAKYFVTKDTFRIDFYEVSGDLHKGEERTVKLINSHGIIKGDENKILKENKAA